MKSINNSIYFEEILLWGRQSYNSKEEYYNLTDWQLGTDGISKLLFDSDSQFLIGFATAMGDYYVSPITVAEVSDLLGYSQNTNFVQRLNTPSSVLYLMLFYANKLKNACEYSTKCSLSNIDKITDSYEYVFYRRKKNKAGKRTLEPVLKKTFIKGEKI